jgi:hypothetical protein
VRVYLTGYIYRNKHTGRCAIYRGPAAAIHGYENVVMEDLDSDGIMFVLIPFKEFREGWEECDD